MYLISEESVLYVGRGVMVDHDHNDASYHLSYLMIYETLPLQFKQEVIFVIVTYLEIEDISLSLSVFCLQVFRVIMEVVGSYELLATFIQFLQ